MTVMPHESSIRETRVLLSGLGMGESPRWHDGRLWFSNWGTNEIVAVDLNGNSEVMGRGGGGSGWAANWLLDGRTLITGDELIRVEPDGSRVQHADLSHISPYGWSEITVDGRGNIYVNTINFDFAGLQRHSRGCPVDCTTCWNRSPGERGSPTWSSFMRLVFSGW
jgi:sugar lactone lactonase YvrE